jgi:pre-rRNA-processing protein IPI3
VRTRAEPTTNSRRRRQIITRIRLTKLHPPPFINAVSAQVSKNALDVWGLDKESALHKFFVGEPMGVVASSPDGAFFAAGSLTGAAYLWEVSTGKLVRTWPAHFKAVSAIAFNSDGSVLVTGGDDTVVSVWCLAALLDPASTSSASVNPTHSWAEHSLPVASICVGTCGGGGAGLVVSCSADRTCKIWTLGGGYLLRTVSLPAALRAVAIDACEATLYAGAVDGRVFEVPLNASASMAQSTDGSSGACAVLEGHTRAVNSLACTADGERVISASDDGTCRVWDAASRQTTHVLRHPKAVPFVAIALAPRCRIVMDDGALGGNEKRKLSPLAPFSRFASAAQGKGGKGLRPWEGAPIVMRGAPGVSSTSTPGADVTLGDTIGRASKRPRGGVDEGDAGGAGSGGVGEDVEDLLKKLAAAEAEAKAAKEETASWKVKHGELRAFVAAELVNDAASK